MNDKVNYKEGVWSYSRRFSLVGGLAVGRVVVLVGSWGVNEFDYYLIIWIQRSYYVEFVYGYRVFEGVRVLNVIILVFSVVFICYFFI